MKEIIIGMNDDSREIIGIILMVFITVLMAAVIAAFVFGMAGSRVTAMNQPDCYKNIAPPIITSVINYDTHYDISFAKTVCWHKPQILRNYIL